MRILALTAILSAISSGEMTVFVVVKYPQSNVGQTQSFGLGGTAPLDWGNFLQLSNTATNTWSASFKIPDFFLNASNPTWSMDMKVVVQPQQIFQMGANHREIFHHSSGNTAHVSIYPYFQTPSGATQTLKQIWSPQLNNSRDVWLYIPPVMVENPFAVSTHTLIMHDGQNLQPTPNSPPDYMGNWSVATHIDDLIAAEKIEQVFVVGPYNTGENRINEYTYSKDPQYGGGEGDLYLDFLQHTLLPRVQQQFNLCTEKRCLGILGSSLGGLISCYAGVTRPHVYGVVGCMSSSFWWNNGDFLSTIIPRLTASETQRYYVDCGDSGDSDDDLQDTSQVATAFAASRKGLMLGVNYFWYLQRGGQHNEAFWSKRFHHPMQWLYGHAAVWNNGLGAL